MKSIEIDDDLYAFIASQTKHIGESASQILRRLLLPEDGAASNNSVPERSAEVSALVTSAKEKSQATPETIGETQPTKDNVGDVSPAVVTSAAKSKSKASTPKRGASIETHNVSEASKKRASANTSIAKASTKSRAVSASVTDVSASHDKRDILSLVSKDALSTFTKRVDQFLFVLSAAHKLNGDTFSKVESIRGKNRTYFATSKAALLENGSSTNPKVIPDSPFWVVTNNNTAKKTNMLEQVLRSLGYQADVVETVIARFSSEA